MHSEVKEQPLYGLIAEFDDPEDIVVAAHKAREAGYKRMDAYTPFPIHGLDTAIGFHDPKVPWMIFLGGVAGAVAGFGLQSWVTTYAYPLNVGGRPLAPWPYFIPITFECTVLFAAFAAVFGMLALNGLPRPNQPIFNAPRFDYATQDRFFLCIEASDPQFDVARTGDFLRSLNPQAVEEVPNS